MKFEKLTMAQAMVKWLVPQKVDTQSGVKPLFPGLFGIFGHGNVTCLAEALERVQDVMPTIAAKTNKAWRLLESATAKPNVQNRS